MTTTKPTSPSKSAKKTGAKETVKKQKGSSSNTSEVISSEPLAENRIDSSAGENEAATPPQNSTTTTQPTFADLNEQYLTIVRRIEKDIREVKLLGKRLQQAHTKEVKQLQSAIKSGRRRRTAPKDPNGPDKKPKGIAWPGPLSTELAAFLKVEPETLLARTQVIKRLADYIRTQNLQNPKDKRLIVPDKALQQLLKFPEDFNEPISYFNLQRLLKHHFPTSSTASAAAKPQVEV